MSKEVKRFYIMPGSVQVLLSGDPAYTPMTNHLTDVHTVPLVLASDYDALLAENERLRMQLVACGVVALANTPESAAEARVMHPDYMSASCQDVMRAVDSEMALLAERDALNELLRGVYPQLCARRDEQDLDDAQQYLLAEECQELIDGIDAALQGEQP